MSKSSIPFGRPMRDAHFMIAPEYTPLNHGAYGTYPKSVRDEFHKWQALSEARPDSWVRYDFPKHLNSSIEAIAAFLDIPSADVVLVKNTTTAVNVVLRSLRFVQGDVILHLSTVYGANAKTIEYLKETTPVDSVNLDMQYPISDDEVVDRFCASAKEIIRSGRRPRLAIFDTISSMPGVRVPWEGLIEQCSNLGILSFVDGAHGVGHIDLDLRNHQPDFFVSNLHKWLFVPRSCAVFYVPRKNQHLIRSALPTSHGFVPLPKEGATKIPDPLANRKVLDSPFQKLFRFVATMDDSSYLCVKAALKFREEICEGEDAIRAYNNHLAMEGGRKVASILGTETMEDVGKPRRCFFANVRLPLAIGDNAADIRTDNALNVAEWIVEKLVDDYDMYFPIYLHAGKMWARFSAQIYIDLDDVERGAIALREICERAKGGEYLPEANGTA